MKIGIYIRVIKTNEQNLFLTNLLSICATKNIELFLYENFANQLKKEGVIHNAPHFSNNLKTGDLDYLLSLGGDGTMLDTLALVKNTKIPVLGINMGRFGFLASSQMEDIENTLNKLEKKEYSIDKRSVLELLSNDELFGEFPYALNDFVIHKKDSSSMITVRTYLDGELLNSYWADGLIVATPSGSSGYSLSCGGPLVFPGSSNFIITPIAPHNLTVRPVVVSNKHKISFDVECRTNSFLGTLDSRSVSLKNGVQITIQKANYAFRLIRLNGETYIDTLRKKLLWGLDKRN